LERQFQRAKLKIQSSKIKFKIMAKVSIYEAILQAIDTVKLEDYKDYIRPEFKQDLAPFNPFSNNFYTGSNKFILSIYQRFGVVKTNKYGTFKQIKEAGGKLKKGAKHFKVFHYSKYYFDEKTKKRVSQKKYENLTEKQQDEISIKSYVKYFQVFNLQDVENIEFLDKLDYPKTALAPLNDQIETFVAKTNAEIKTVQTDVAYYDPKDDFIGMPPINAFIDMQSYYSTLFHELIHWTGAESRLKRNFKSDKKSYAFEELIAEIGAILLYTKFDNYTAFKSSLAYIKSYLNKLDKEEQQDQLKEAYLKARDAEKYLEKPKLVFVL